MSDIHAFLDDSILGLYTFTVTNSSECLLKLLAAYINMKFLFIIYFSNILYLIYKQQVKRTPMSDYFDIKKGSDIFTPFLS